MSRSFLVVFAAALVGLATFATPAAAQSAPHCAPGQMPVYSNGFAWMEQLLGPIMGDPATCPYVNNANGDVLQETTTGLAFWRKSTNTPTFTDGWEHWAWTEEGLLYWTGASIDPPAIAVQVVPPTVDAPVFTQVEIPLIALGQGDVGCNDAVVFVQRNVPQTTAPLTAALEELLAIDEQTVGSAGYYNALASSNLQVVSASIENGVATIQLTGQVVSGGVCDDPRIEAQLERVALQYDTVDSVNVYVDGQLLDQVLSQR